MFVPGWLFECPPRPSTISFSVGLIRLDWSILATDMYSNNRELVFAGSPVLAQLLLNGIGVQPPISLQLMSLLLICSQGP